MQDLFNGIEDGTILHPRLAIGTNMGESMKSLSTSMNCLLIVKQKRTVNF
jgi:hypothetical protein